MNFLNKFKKNKKLGRSVLTKEIEASERAGHDWKKILFGFTCLLIIAVLIDGYLFIKINRGDFFKAELNTEVNQATSNRKTLLDANSFFENRQKAYEDFTNGTTTEMDPSL